MDAADIAHRHPSLVIAEQVFRPDRHFAVAARDVQHVQRLRQTGQVALYIGKKNGNTEFGKALRKALQRHGLAGAGSPGDETMPVGEPQVEIDVTDDGVPPLAGGVVVVLPDPDTVSKAIERIAEKNQLSVAQLRSALQSEGMSFRQFQQK